MLIFAEGKFLLNLKIQVYFSRHWKVIKVKEGFLIFFMYVIQHCFICRPSDSTVLEVAGIETKTAATDIDSQTL
jgi:hypothetical protein